MDPLQIISAFEQAELSLPEILTISLTDACNLDCAHCWVEAGPFRPVTQVPTSVLRELLSDFVQLGGSGVRLTGGEPLLHPDWLELLGYAGELGLQTIILQTNGILFGPDDLSALRALDLAGLQIQISLDGARAETHDLVRGEGTFNQTLEGLRQLVDYGLGPQLALFMTEMRHNLQELPALFALAADLGIGSVSSGCLVSCGRAETEVLIMPPEPEQYLALLERYAGDEDFRRLYARLGCVAALEWCSAENRTAECCRFIATPYLTAVGVLYPCLMCHADDYAVFGVFEKGLVVALNEGIPLWSELQSISRQRTSALPECQACVLLKSCAGGCMGRAWGSFADFMRVEDRCRQRQVIASWKEKS